MGLFIGKTLTKGIKDKKGPAGYKNNEGIYQHTV